MATKLSPNVARIQVDLELALALRSPDQRQHHETVDRPVGGEGQRNHADQGVERAQLVAREEPDRPERAAHQRFAARRIHDASDAVLELQTDRHQGVGAAEQQADDDEVHHEDVANADPAPAWAGAGWKTYAAQPVFNRTGL